MIPSVLQELKEGRFKLTKHELGNHGEYLTYVTESNWIIELSDPFIPFVKLTYINSQKVGWIFAWRIRKAIKKGARHE